MNLVWSDGAFYLTSEACMESDAKKMPKGKHARSVLAKLEEGGGKVHYSELSKELSPRSAWDAVQALQKKGLIRRDDDDFVWLTHGAIGNPMLPI
jgi:Mn-dependent DtxR family transcriptional regulator